MIMSNKNLRDCISRCSVGICQPFYYDTRFGTKINDCELNDCYYTRFIYHAQGVKRVKTFAQSGYIFHLIVVINNNIEEPCDVTYSSIDHSFTNNTHDPSVIITAILTNIDYKPFFVTNKHPYFIGGYTADYMNMGFNRPNRAIRTIKCTPTVSFYSDMLNNPTMYYDSVDDDSVDDDSVDDDSVDDDSVDDDSVDDDSVDDDSVDDDSVDTWDTISNNIDNYISRSNWEDIDYQSDEPYSFNQFNENEFDKQLDMPTSIDAPANDTPDSPTHTRGAHSTDLMNILQVNYHSMLDNDVGTCDTIPISMFTLPINIPKICERADNLMFDIPDIDYNLILTNIVDGFLIGVSIRFSNGKISDEKNKDVFAYHHAPCRISSGIPTTDSIEDLSGTYLKQMRKANKISNLERLRKLRAKSKNLSSANMHSRMITARIKSESAIVSSPKPTTHNTSLSYMEKRLRELNKDLDLT
jgi:hypothetical protein